MVIYKTKMFKKNNFKKIPINDADLIDIANEYAGHFEADLGGGIIKKRICIQGKERVVELEQLYFINRK